MPRRFLRFMNRAFANVREALGDDWDTFASTYDGRVLVLDSIEKETDGKQVGLPANHRPTNTSDPSVSTVNVTDLYALVNQDYQKYLPVPNEAHTNERQEHTEEVGEAAFGLVRDRYVQAYLDTEMADRIDETARLLGVTVRFTPNVAGGAANAELRGSEVLIERDNPNPVLFLLGHEWTHRMQDLAPEEYQRFRGVIVSDIWESSKQLQDRYQRYGLSLSEEAAMDEAAADYAGRLLENGQLLDDFITRNRKDRTLLERLRDAIAALLRKLGSLTSRERRQAEAVRSKLDAALDAAAESTRSGQDEAATKTGGRDAWFSAKDIETLTASENQERNHSDVSSQDRTGPTDWFALGFAADDEDLRRMAL